MEPPNHFDEIRILLISDDDDVIRAIRSGLAGFTNRGRLSVARSGLEAVTILKQHPVILVEHGQANGSGFNLFEALAENSTPGHSIVFVISSPDQDYDSDSHYGDQVAGYLQKPVSPERNSQLPQMLDYISRTTEPVLQEFEESAA